VNGALDSSWDFVVKKTSVPLEGGPDTKNSFQLVTQSVPGNQIPGTVVADVGVNVDRGQQVGISY
jgi:hypothetical protein